MVKAHRLSDGTTISIKTTKQISGSVIFTEVPSRKRPGAVFMLLDEHMFLVFGEQIVPIRHPAYEYAATVKGGAAMALAFCVESAEGTIAEAAKDGLPVEDYYAKPDAS